MCSRSDYQPTAPMTNLAFRADLLRKLRRFFDERGFLEVETPLLSADTVIDRHIEPIGVELPGRQKLWLQTSPEFAMKRLLAAGATAIYQITKSFRGGEQGALHNLEFTIVEWYRVGDSYTDGMQLLSELAQHLLGCEPAEQLSYRDAFRKYVGIDPHRAAHADLRSVLPEHLGDIENTSIDEWLNYLLAEQVEPKLGRGRPTILFDYPATQAALAKVRQDDPPVAERFELYIDGIELANGYHELTDANELRRRNQNMNEQRNEAGLGELPVESRLLAAMDSGLPDCTGVALGFDRLVMLAAGATSIAEVMAFPADRA